MLFEQLLSDTPSMSRAMLETIQQLIEEENRGNAADSQITIEDISLLLTLSRAVMVSDVAFSDDDFEVPLFFSHHPQNTKENIIYRKIYFTTIFFQLLFRVITKLNSSLTAVSSWSSEDLILLSRILRQVLHGERGTTSWLSTLRCKEIISFVFYCICFHDIIEKKIFDSDIVDNGIEVIIGMLSSCVIVIYEEIVECQFNLLQTFFRAISVLLSSMLSKSSERTEESRQDDLIGNSSTNFGMSHSQSITALNIMLKLLEQLSGILPMNLSQSSSSSIVTPVSMHSTESNSYVPSPRESFVSSIFIRVMQDNFSSFISLSSRCKNISLVQDWNLRLFPRIASISSEFFVNLLNYIRKSMFHTQNSGDSSGIFQRVFFMRLLVAVLFRHPEETCQSQIVQVLIHAFNFPLVCRRYLYLYLREGLYDHLSSYLCQSNNFRVHNSVLSILLRQVQIQMKKILVVRKNNRRKSSIHECLCYENLEIDFENLISTVKSHRSADSDENVYFLEEDVRQLFLLEGLLSILLDHERSINILHRMTRKINRQSTSEDNDNQEMTFDSTMQSFIDHIDAIFFSIQSSVMNDKSSILTTPNDKTIMIDAILQFSVQADCIRGCIDLFRLCSYIAATFSNMTNINISQFENIIMDMYGALDILFDTISLTFKDGSMKTYEDLDTFLTRIMTIGITDLLHSSKTDEVEKLNLLSSFYDLLIFDSLQKHMNEVATSNTLLVQCMLRVPYSILLSGLVITLNASKTLVKYKLSQQNLPDILASCCHSYQDVVCSLTKDRISIISQLTLQNRQMVDEVNSMADSYPFTTSASSNMASLSNLQHSRRYDVSPPYSSSTMSTQSKNKHVKLISESLNLQMFAVRAELLEVIALSLKFGFDCGALKLTHLRIENFGNFDDLYWASEMRDSIQQGLSLRSYVVRIHFILSVQCLLISNVAGVP